MIAAPDQIHLVAQRAYAAGATHLAPVFAEVLAGRIGALFLASRAGQFPRRQAAEFRLPTVVIIGDDDHLATGPQGWRCAAEATGWAAAAFVHGAGARPDHYREAAGAVLQVRRLLLVETSSTFVRAWAERIAPKPVLAIVPARGLHPAPVPRRAHH